MLFPSGFRRLCITIMSISILCSSLINRKFSGITSIFSNNNIFVESAVTGNVTVCVSKDKELMDASTCKDRLHTNLDVYHGERDFHYIFRKKNEPDKGLYVIVTTSENVVMYQLDYKVTVPLLYKEHTDPITYKEAGYDSLLNACGRVTNQKCVTSKDLPPGLSGSKGVCCICDINVTGPTVRGNYDCSMFKFIFNKIVESKKDVAMSYSCLEIEGPWYRLYKPAYPPSVNRSVGIKVFKFDSSKGLIPNLSLENKGKFDNIDYPPPKKEAKKVITKESPEKLTSTVPASTAKSLEQTAVEAKQVKKVDPNFRNVKLDQDIKEERLDDLDINLSYISSGTKDGSPPHMINDYIAVPAFPRTNETVKGSSMADKCKDSTWDSSVKCPSYMKERLCNLWRCTVNMRTINPEAVDTTGTTCDKIGVSIQTWGSHRRICHSQNGSCIKRQLYWYLEQEKEKAKLPVLYGTEPILAFKKIKQTSSTNTDGANTIFYDDNRIHYLSYVHNQDDVTRLKIDTFDGTVTEIISESPGFITSSKIDNECKLSSDKSCNLEVDVKNMGIKKADFTIRANCYGSGTEKLKENAVASINETTLGIEGNGSKKFNVPLKLKEVGFSGEGTCDVVLYSSLKAVLDKFVVPIKITKAKPSFGKDPKELDKRIFTVPEKKHIVVLPPPKKEKVVADKPEPKKTEEPQCNCAKWNIFCMLINFKSCIVSKLNKVYMYIVIALGVLLAILLLPLLMPVFIFLAKRLIHVFKMPFEAAKRRKISKINKMAIDIDMNATQNVVPNEC